MFTMARLLSPILFCFILLASWSSWGNKNLNNHTKGFTPLLNSFEYNLLTRVNKLNYLQALRKTLLDFELKMQKKGFKGKKSYYGNLFEHLFPHAFAEYKSEEWCVVGGRARIRDNGKCPIFGYPCSIDGTDAKENYKCGAIYGNVCVPIEDRRTLSARCHEAGKDVELDPPNYTQATHDIVTAYQQELCGGDVTDGSPCDFLNKRVAKINDQFRTPTRSTVISSTTQGKCHDIYKEGCNKNPHLLEPQIQIDGATFSEHVKFTTHQCYQETGVEKFTNQFTVVDGKGVERKFYFDPEKKEICADINVPSSVWQSLEKKSQEILNDNLKESCKDKASCDVYKDVIEPRLKQLKQTSLSKKAKLCSGNRCPEDEAIQICQTAFEHWNKNAEDPCPGYEAKVLNTNINILKNKIKELDDEEINQADETTKTKYTKVCHRIFQRKFVTPNLESYCDNLDYADMVKNMIKEFEEQITINEPFYQNLETLIFNQRAIANVPRHCYSELDKCIKVIENKVAYSSSDTIKSFKSVCHNEFNQRRRLISNTKDVYSPITLLSGNGETIANIKVNQTDKTLTFESTNPAQASLTVQFSDQGRIFASHESKDAPTNGQLYVKNKICERPNSGTCDPSKITANIFEINGMDYQLPSAKCGLAQVYAQDYSPTNITNDKGGDLRVTD